MIQVRRLVCLSAGGPGAGGEEPMISRTLAAYLSRPTKEGLCVWNDRAP